MIHKKWFYLSFVFTLALGIGHIWSSGASAQSSYFSSRGCTSCHAAPVAATCAGCHQHSGTLTASTNKTSYAPGETVTVTLTSSGARSGWIGARLYNQSGAEIARSTGSQSGMGGSTVYPAVLSAPAPAAAGTYTWKMAYLGNQNGSGSGDVHGEKSVNVSFSVAAAAPAVDTTAPVVSAFTLPATSTSLTVPVSALTATDNVAVTGYLINKSATRPTASAAGWTATKLTSVTAVAGSNTFYAWAKDAAGNVSASRSATVTVTASSSADATPPTLNVSALANGAATNKSTLNVSGSATDAGGLKSVTVNGQPVVVNAGSFSTALNLVAGANVITVVATDNAGNQTTDSRTVTYDLAAPVLTVSNPADNSTSAQSFVTVSGSVNENSTVSVKVNSGSAQSAAMNGTNFTATVNLAAGINTIDITATDLAGNTTSAKRTVTYSAPQSQLTLAVTNPAQDVTTSRSSMTIQGSVKDAAGSVRVTVKVNDRTYYPRVGSTGGFSQSVTFSSARTYVITVNARDYAGHTATVTRNVIYRPYSGDGGSTGGTTSHPFGWTDPRSSHDNYVDANGVSGCVSCHSIDPASKGQPMSCYNCHGQEWSTPSTGGSTGGSTTTSHPFGWTSPRSSHPGYVEDNGVSSCVSCHSIDPASKGQPMSCFNCHGQEWSTPSTGGSTGGSTTTSHPFGWTSPRSSHPGYVEDNGVSSCTSCHSTDSDSKGQPMSCYNCHGREWQRQVSRKNEDAIVELGVRKTAGKKAGRENPASFFYCSGGLGIVDLSISTLSDRFLAFIKWKGRTVLYLCHDFDQKPHDSLSQPMHPDNPLSPEKRVFPQERSQ